jgi:hypothetical protein
VPQKEDKRGEVGAYIRPQGVISAAALKAQKQDSENLNALILHVVHILLPPTQPFLVRSNVFSRRIRRATARARWFLRTPDQEATHSDRARLRSLQVRSPVRRPFAARPPLTFRMYPGLKKVRFMPFPYPFNTVDISASPMLAAKPVLLYQWLILNVGDGNPTASQCSHCAAAASVCVFTPGVKVRDLMALYSLDLNSLFIIAKASTCEEVRGLSSRRLFILNTVHAGMWTAWRLAWNGWRPCSLECVSHPFL